MLARRRRASRRLLGAVGIGSAVTGDQEPAAVAVDSSHWAGASTVSAQHLRSTTMTTTEKIIESIEKRVQDLNEQINTLSAARAALITSDSPEAKRPHRNAASSVSVTNADTHADKAMTCTITA